MASGKKKDILRYAPVLLFILAFSIRIYFWPAGLFHTDSVIAVQNAELSVSDGRIYYLQGQLGYPAYAFLNTGLFFLANKIFQLDSGETLLIFTSILLGSLSVVLMYFFASKLTGSSHAGIYSALVMCFMPLHLSLSTYVKDQMLGSCAMMASLYLALHASENKTLKNRILAVSMLGFTLAIRQQEFLLIPSFLILYFWNQKPVYLKKTKEGVRLVLSRDMKTHLADAAVLTVPAVLIFVAFFIPRMFWQPNFNLIESFKGAGGEQVQGFSIFSPLLTHYSIPWAIKTLTPAGLLILMFGFIVGYKKNKMVWAALSMWMIPYFLVLGNFAHVSPYFIFAAFIPAAVFIGWGLNEAGIRWGPKIPAAVMILLVSWMVVSIKPVLDYRSQRCGPCEFAEKIGEITPPGSFVESADESRHIEYYGGRRQIGKRPNPFNVTDLNQYFAEVDSILGGGTRIYITTMGAGNDFLARGILAASPKDETIPVNMATGRAYDNIKAISRQSGVYFVDRETNMPLPIQGLYGLELFNHYKAEPVLSFENEDWHHKDLELGTYTSVLYELKLR